MKITRFIGVGPLTVLLVTVLLIAAQGCHSSPTKTSDAEAHQNSQIKGLQTEVNQIKTKVFGPPPPSSPETTIDFSTTTRPAPTTTTTRSYPESPVTSIAVTPTTLVTPPWITRLMSLEAYDYPHCRSLGDIYTYMAVGEPRVDSYGGTFHYDCQSHYWSWYVDGRPGDKWRPADYDANQNPAKGKSANLGIGLLHPPRDRRNPKSAKALRLMDLHAGLFVCRHYPKLEQSIKITDVFTSVLNSGGKILAYPAYSYLDPSGKPSSPAVPASLEDDGVIPFANQGYWAEAYFTAGSC